MKLKMENERNQNSTINSINSDENNVPASLVLFNVTFDKPGDFYEFTVDAYNEGTVDAKVSSVVKAGLSTEEEQYVDYAITYADGTEIQPDDFLGAGEKRKLKVKGLKGWDVRKLGSFWSEGSKGSAGGFVVGYFLCDETCHVIAGSVRACLDRIVDRLVRRTAVRDDHCPRHAKERSAAVNVRIKLLLERLEHSLQQDCAKDS